MTTASVLSKLYIGPIATADTVSEFEALTWAEIKEVEDIGELGDTFADVPFTALGSGRTVHHKGSVDGGTFTVTVGITPADAGQVAILAASKSRARGDYAFKVTLDDAGSGDPTTYYFLGKVMSNKGTVGAADAVAKRTYTVAVNSDVIEVPAE